MVRKFTLDLQFAISLWMICIFFKARIQCIDLLTAFELAIVVMGRVIAPLERPIEDAAALRKAGWSRPAALGES